jgi:hypothetical protein
VVTADWDSIQFELAKSITVTAVYQYTPILAGALGMPNVTVFDVEAIHAGSAHRSELPQPSPAELS